VTEVVGDEYTEAAAVTSLLFTGLISDDDTVDVDEDDEADRELDVIAAAETETETGVGEMDGLLGTALAMVIDCCDGSCDKL